MDEVKTKILLCFSLFLFIPSVPHLSNTCVKSRHCVYSYSDQSLEVDEIFPRIIILDADDDEEDEDEEEEDERCDTMELDFNEITFN